MRWSPPAVLGKHHTTGHNHQVVCDLTGRVLHISDPLPGNTHDTTAARHGGVLDILDPGQTLTDKGYIGTGTITPVRKPPRRELVEWQKEFNTTINKMHYVIERAIANFKTWRTMHTDYRRLLSTYSTAFEAIRSLHFYKIIYE